jgi:hypothetical protein
LAHRLLPQLDKKQSQAIGWLGHFDVGLLFSLVYVELWRRGKPANKIKNNLILGAVSGALAVGIWKLTFDLHPLPPKLNFTKYYVQLIPAHMVFAIFAGIGRNILKRDEYDYNQATQTL